MSAGTKTAPSRKEPKTEDNNNQVINVEDEKTITPEEFAKEVQKMKALALLLQNRGQDLDVREAEIKRKTELLLQGLGELGGKDGDVVHAVTVFNERLTELKRKETELTVKFKGIEVLENELKTERDKLTEERNALERKVSEMVAERTEASKKALTEEFENKRKSLQEEHDNTMSTLKASIAEEKQEIENSLKTNNDSVARQKETLAELQKHISEREAALEIYESALKELNTRLSKKREDIGKMVTNVTALIDAINDVEFGGGSSPNKPDLEELDTTIKSAITALTNLKRSETAKPNADGKDQQEKSPTDAAAQPTANNEEESAVEETDNGGISEISPDN
jgi:chromosome segregation ATPase